MKNLILQFVEHLLHPVNKDDPRQVIKEATRLLEEDNNYYAALDLLKPLASSGHALAQTIVGGIFRELTTLPDNYGEAIRWFEMAAEQGFPLAELNLGIMHLDGLGCPPDARAAASWFQRAGEHGQALAQFEMAKLILRGALGPVNVSAALHWMNQAVNQGYTPAVNELARMYETGDGVAKNPQQALQLRRDAAAGGDPEARKVLGEWLYNQAEHTQEQSMFMARLEEAAEYGNVLAQSRLGTIYNSGLGVAPNQHKAAIYWEMAAAQGHGESKASLDHLLSPRSDNRGQGTMENVTPHVPRIG
jgi:TPR repeat protein